MAKKLTDEVVISGLSGRLPESSTIQEFKDNLFNGIDMVNDDPRRWAKGLHNMPGRLGKIKSTDLESFDYQFFGVPQKQAECMDPQMKMMLESTYEAIVDAGLNPQELRGSRTGVYVGVSESDTERYWTDSPDRVNGYGLTGCARAMFANRLSFTYDFKGPSFALDAAGSSSLYAISRAFADLNAGYCDAAIVVGSNLVLNPNFMLQYQRHGMLSADGKCKVFDETAAGFVRADGCVAIFMQKASHARRVYATVLNIRTNVDGAKENEITFPNGKMQYNLMRETYDEIGLNPADVTMLEANGMGTSVDDVQEVNSITDLFCTEERKTAFLIGSVKSNMGHSEAAAGLSAIVKVLLAMEAGAIPGNLHYTAPNPDLRGIIDGRIKVVDCNTPWTGGIIGLNSFGFGGTNAHIILKSNPKQKSTTSNDKIPRLTLVSGRTSESIDLLLDEIDKNKSDSEFLALINEIHRANIPLHYYRGYAVIDDAAVTVRTVNEVTDAKRPIWFIYTGAGAQWASMAKDLMPLELFWQAINRCADVLRPEGVDLIEILTKSEESTFDNALKSFVAIVSVQIGLTDVLTQLGISPTGIVGHSFGEISCGYADGCLTAEQTILLAYWHGRYVLDSQLKRGMMAAVGLSWEEAKARLPDDISAACHNSADNVTISGVPESVVQFIEQLTRDGTFVKPVKSSNYAFHSKYMGDAEQEAIVHNIFEQIIPTPKNRTSRWLSTSVPESNWSTPLAEQCSAVYYLNNILSPVLFYEATQKIPENAICIEIAPSGLLQAILTRSMGDEAIILSLLKRRHKNNLIFLLSNIGNLYLAGAQPDVSKLYDTISYPVGRGTPMLNSKIGWDHSLQFMVPKFGMNNSTLNQIIVDVNLSDEKDAYLTGHSIDGRILFPASGYMTMAWRILAKLKKRPYDKMPVVLEDTVFHRATILPKDASNVKFAVKMSKSTGYFEIIEGGALVASGKIYVPDNIELEQLPLDPLEHDNSGLPLKAGDIYKELRLRGYDYAGHFCGVVDSDSKALTGKLQWQNNWISFIDTMLQFFILGKEIRELYLPTKLERTIINPLQHHAIAMHLNQTKENVPVYMYNDINVVKAGGIEMRGLKTSLAPRRTTTQSQPILQRLVFVPLQNANHHSSETSAVSVAICLVLENSGVSLKIKAADVVESIPVDTSLAQTIQTVIENEPNLASEVTIITNQPTESYVQAVDKLGIRVVKKDPSNGPVDTSKNHLITAYDIVERHNANVILENLKASILADGFILLEENMVGYDDAKALKLFASVNLRIVSVQCNINKKYILLRRNADIAIRNKIVVPITNRNYDWLEQLKSALAIAESEHRYVYIVGQGEELLGAVGLINCIKYEKGGRFVRLFFIQDANVEKFSFTSEFYVDQLNMDLTSNVYKNGVWGTFRYMKLDVQDGVSSSLVEHAYVNTLTKGDLSSLSWIESPLSLRLPDATDNRIELCTVYYAPINFRDVMLSSGKLAVDALPGDLATQDCILGLEFSGRDSTGRRIMAMVQAKSLATTCVAQRNMIWEVPSNWTMLQASTIPCVYSTVYYALIVRGTIKKGESILIHAGSGGVGQAAISVALHHGLMVYTTVGSKEKREFLKKTFPQLTDANISNSRDTSFEQFIMRATQGRGVDLVLNSLANEKLQASIRCLGLNGRFLEIGKFDLNNNTPLGMSVFLKNVSFHGILLDSVMDGDDETIDMVVGLVADGIKNGAVRPLTTTVFDGQEIEQAFRFMASGKHIGKVVVKIRDEEQQKIIKPIPKQIAAIPRMYMHSEKTYIIVGGLGGFGLELADWFVKRGATKLVLTSRSGVKTGYQSLMLRRWTNHGVKVAIDTNDVTTLNGARRLITAAKKLGPVGGIFNLAGVLRIALLEVQTVADFKMVTAPKVDATKHLDAVSRELCPDLDYFVCFSSVVSGCGIAGQLNYGFANSVMERICEQRAQDKLPGQAIQWGSIADTGMVIDLISRTNDVIIIGTLPQRMQSCLKIFELFMQQPAYPVLSSWVLAEKKMANTGRIASLVTSVANILGMKDLRNVNKQITLNELGMDSLMGAEIKQTLERNYEIFLSAEEVRELSFAKIEALQEK